MTRGPTSIARLAIWLPLTYALVAAVAGVWMLHSVVELSALSGSLGAYVGDALLASGGKTDAGEIIAAYPPNTLLPLIAVHTLTGLTGFHGANLLSACLAAGLAAMWLRGMLLAGFRPFAALAMTLLLALNPLFIRAAAEGPELMLTMWGAWVFAISAFAVRGRGGVNDLMLCSASLMLLAFCGQSGMLMAVATVPFLTLVMPADIRARSTLSVYLVLLFPVLFALLGFVLVNWMMLHDPLAFLRPQIEAAGGWFAGSWRDSALEITFAVASAPILVGLFILARGRRPIQAIALALTGTAMLFALLTLQAGIGLSLATALSPTVGLAAAAAMRWPAQDSRALRVVLLLALGLIGSGSALYAQDFAYVSGSEIREDRQNSEDRRLGVFLRDHDNVMIDAAAHPHVVAARGSAAGLLTSSETAFEVAMLERRVAPDASVVAVPAPDASRNADTLGRILPGLYTDGAPGFRLIYDEGGWRVWARQSNPSRQGKPLP